MQAGLGASKLLILVGAGVGTSIMLRNNKISNLISDLSSLVFAKHLKEDGEGSFGGDGDSTAAAAAEVDRLIMDLRQLAASNRPFTIVIGGDNSGANFGSLFLLAAVIGVAGCGYMLLRGSRRRWSLSDIMCVAKRNTNNAVVTLGKQLDSLWSALLTAKRQLTSRLEFMKQLDSVSSALVTIEQELTSLRELMDRSVEDNTAVTNVFQEQVHLVREEIAQLGLGINGLNRTLEGLEAKIDEVAEHQTFANQGLYLLSEFALREMKGRQNAD